MRKGQAEPAGGYLWGRSPGRSGSCCCTCHDRGSVSVGLGPTAPLQQAPPHLPPIPAAAAASRPTDPSSFPWPWFPPLLMIPCPKSRFPSPQRVPIPMMFLRAVCASRSLAVVVVGKGLVALWVCSCPRPSLVWARAQSRSRSQGRSTLPAWRLCWLLSPCHWRLGPWLVGPIGHVVKLRCPLTIRSTSLESVNMYICVCVCIYLYIYPHIYIYMCNYMYIATHVYLRICLPLFLLMELSMELSELFSRRVVNIFSSEQGFK